MEHPRGIERSTRWGSHLVRGRGLHVVAAVLVVGGLLLVPAAGPGASQVAQAAPAAAVSTDPLAPRTAVCSAGRRSDCTVRQSFQVGALTRRSYLYLPPAAARGPVPLVVAVHGWRMSPRTLDDMLGLTALARREGFAVALPQGYGEKDGAAGYQASWNAGTCCGPAVRDGVDDLAMMDATVATAKAAFRSNGRVSYMGLSNGAMLAYRLWCQNRGSFSAFVAVSGTLTVPTCAPARTRPFLAIHGMRDTIVPYAGCSVSQPRSSCAFRLHTDLVSGHSAVWTMRLAAGCTGAKAHRHALATWVSDSSGCRTPGPTHMTVGYAAHDWVTDRRRYGVNETMEAWAFVKRR